MKNLVKADTLKFVNGGKKEDVGEKIVGTSMSLLLVIMKR